MKNKLICALDFSSRFEVDNFLKKVGSDLSWVKVGMELFYKEGSDIVRSLKDQGYKVFLDLKLHDIPNTVEKATKNLLALDVDMLNFHAAGGSKMLERVAALQSKKTLLIAVTQLTSTNEAQMHEEQGITSSLQDSVLRYASISVAAGMNGVVCSAHEARWIKEKLPTCITVCPGVRMLSAATHDQARVMSPGQAIANGADYIVMGRNITEAKDPALVLAEIYKDMEVK
jgi:orotidine-5'-phosphate decarboxylase